MPRCPRPHPDPGVTVTRIYITFIDIDDVPDEASTEYEPSEVLQRKINALAELLDCSPEEAERILLDRL